MRKFVATPTQATELPDCPMLGVGWVQEVLPDGVPDARISSLLRDDDDPSVPKHRVRCEPPWRL